MVIYHEILHNIFLSNLLYTKARYPQMYIDKILNIFNDK